MRAVYADWESPEPGQLVELSGDWVEAFVDAYATRRNPVALRRAFTVARLNRASHAVVETRYVDADYRSEFSAHFSRAFLDVPSSTHRIHFLRTGQLSADDLLDLPGDCDYLGYLIVAPSLEGRVGRTVLAPPATGPDGGPLADVLSSATDAPHLFGQSLSVRGVPFIEQDAQFGRCVHAVYWMSHHTAYLKAQASRVVMARLAEWQASRAAGHQSFPSDGLSSDDLCEMLGDGTGRRLR